MVKRIAMLFILIPAMLLFAYKPTAAATQFRDIVAESALLAEADSGQILFEHNMRNRHPADALARVMTLLLAVAAIENGEVHEDDLVVMTETAWEGLTARNTTLNIRPGEEMTLLELMYSAFVGGAAEACNMIAEHIEGSVEAFVEMMNIRAADLDCESTTFVNTHGQFHENQFTTARDQFFIFREAMSYPLFTEISGVFRHTIAATNMADSRRLTSSNSLLNSGGKYHFRPCTAGMASITFEGGHSFIGLAESEGLSLITVILGSDEIMLADESFDMRNLTEARRLFEWGFSQFGWRTILSSAYPVISAPIMHGAGADSVNLRPESEIRLLLDNNIPLESFVRTITIYSVESGEPLVAPISAGEILGEISLVRNGVEYGPILLVAVTNVELHRFEYIRLQVVDLLTSPTARYVVLGLVILSAGYAALVIRYNVIRRDRLRRIADARQKLIEERRNMMEDDYDDYRAYNPGPRQTSRSDQRPAAPRQAPRTDQRPAAPRQTPRPDQRPAPRQDTRSDTRTVPRQAPRTDPRADPRQNPRKS